MIWLRKHKLGKYKMESIYLTYLQTYWFLSNYCSVSRNIRNWKRLLMHESMHKRNKSPIAVDGTTLNNVNLSPMSQFLSQCLQHFTEPSGSLLHSQDLSTGPYPELDQSSPHHTILSVSTRSSLIVSSPYALVFLVVLFLLAFLPITYKHSSSPPFTPHALPTSSSLT
jgi:hypothetical protein